MAVTDRESRERDECLEKLWNLRERREHAAGGGTPGERSEEPGLDETCVRILTQAGLGSPDGQGGLAFSPEGESRARRLVRSHRIAERLVHDVLGVSFETVACEFEHLVNTEVVDAVCTLLGHPRECPHGSPIPEGDCCRRSEHVVTQRVVPLTELRLGQSGRIAYVYAGADQELHALQSLQVRPGVVITLHQRFPSYVIECEGGSIALDEAVARSVNVWVLDPPSEPVGPSLGAGGPRHRGFRWGFRRHRA